MIRNPFSATGARGSIAIGAAIAISMLLGCSDSDSNNNPIPLTPLEFLRGDSTNDGRVDLSDGVHTNNYLFLAGPPPVCEDAADADDSGILDVNDSVFTWNHLFRGGPSVPAPFPDLGLDDTEDELTCESYALDASSPLVEDPE